MVVPQSCLGTDAGRQTVNVATYDVENGSYEMYVERTARRGDDGAIGIVDGVQDFIGGQVQVRRGA